MYPIKIGLKLWGIIVLNTLIESNPGHGLKKVASFWETTGSVSTETPNQANL